MQGYEPVMLASRKDVPWFDERFRGTAGGKTAHAFHTYQHMSFCVDPSHFVVQMPHTEGDIVVDAAAAIFDQAGDPTQAFGLQ